MTLHSLGIKGPATLSFYHKLVKLNLSIPRLDGLSPSNKKIKISKADNINKFKVKILGTQKPSLNPIFYQLTNGGYLNETCRFGETDLKDGDTLHLKKAPDEILLRIFVPDLSFFFERVKLASTVKARESFETRS